MMASGLHFLTLDSRYLRQIPFDHFSGKLVLLLMSLLAVKANIFLNKTCPLERPSWIPRIREILYLGNNSPKPIYNGFPV